VQVEPPRLRANPNVLSTNSTVSPVDRFHLLTAPSTLGATRQPYLDRNEIPRTVQRRLNGSFVSLDGIDDFIGRPRVLIRHPAGVHRPEIIYRRIDGIGLPLRFSNGLFSGCNFCATAFQVGRNSE
jgi:hypothetical protein